MSSRELFIRHCECFYRQDLSTEFTERDAFGRVERKETFENVVGRVRDG